MLITSESRLVMYSWQALYIQATLWAEALIRPDFRKTAFILAWPVITPSLSTVALSHLCNLSSPLLCSLNPFSPHSPLFLHVFPCSNPQHFLLLPHLPLGITHLPLASFPVFFYTNWKKPWFIIPWWAWSCLAMLAGQLAGETEQVIV